MPAARQSVTSLAHVVITASLMGDRVCGAGESERVGARGPGSVVCGGEHAELQLADAHNRDSYLVREIAERSQFAL